MGFLLKGAFWFSVVLLSLPLLESRETSENEQPLAVGETIFALGVAIEDIRSMCERHPDVCVTGGETLNALGLRARDGARIAYQYLDSALGDGNGAADPLATGTVLGATAEAASAVAGSTPEEAAVMLPPTVRPYTAPQPLD
jgi:hypothetical protein